MGFGEEEELKYLYVQPAILNCLHRRQSQSKFWGVISPNDLTACLEEYTSEKANRLPDKNNDETFLYKILKYKYIITKMESF